MTGKNTNQESRTLRLEAALKANLKRRKAQTRARRAGGALRGDIGNSSTVPPSGLIEDGKTTG